MNLSFIILFLFIWTIIGNFKKGFYDYVKEDAFSNGTFNALANYTSTELLNICGFQWIGHKARKYTFTKAKKRKGLAVRGTEMKNCTAIACEEKGKEADKFVLKYDNHTFLLFLIEGELVLHEQYD